MRNKNEYKLDEERMRKNSAEGDRFRPLILMKGCFMRIGLLEPITLAVILFPFHPLEEILVSLLHIHYGLIPIFGCTSSLRLMNVGFKSLRWLQLFF